MLNDQTIEDVVEHIKRMGRDHPDASIITYFVIPYGEDQRAVEYIVANTDALDLHAAINSMLQHFEDLCADLPADGPAQIADMIAKARTVLKMDAGSDIIVN